MIIEITASMLTAALLGAGLERKLNHAKAKHGQRQIAVKKVSFEPGEMVWDIAFQGDWDGFPFDKMARVISNTQECMSLAQPIKLHNGAERLARDNRIELKSAFAELMNNQPADYDASKDPPEVRKFFRAVRMICAEV